MSIENKISRRDFLKLIGNGILTAGAVNFVGCGNEEQTKTNNSKILRINGIEYQVSDGVISEKNLSRESLKIGLLMDPHGHKGNSKYFADQLTKENVDLYIVGGDLPHSFGDKEGLSDNYREMSDVLEAVGSKGKLTLVYPGNHETEKGYKKVLRDINSKYDNVIDMEEIPVADLEGLTIVGFGGIVNPNFCVPEGYLRNENDFHLLRESIKKHQRDKPFLLATHVPKRYSGKSGLDVIDSGQNVGSSDLGKLRELIDSRFAVSGHIHEAYGIISPNGEPIKEGELSDRLDFNPGAVYDHLKRPNLKPAAGIIEFKGDKARAYVLNR